MAFDIKQYFTSKGTSVKNDADSIREAAEALLSAPAGLTNNSSYKEWAQEALNFLDATPNAPTRWGLSSEQEQVDRAYQWITGAPQPTRANRVWSTFGEGYREELSKLQNEEGNIANIQADGKTVAPADRLSAYQQKLTEFNKSYGTVFGQYSSNLKVGANGYIEQVGADGKPVSALAGSGAAVSASGRTPAQQAAIDRQLAIEKEAFGKTPTATTQNIPGLNTVGLLEADARRRKGTASATDLDNLKYAESKGWSASGTSTPAPANTPIPGLNTNGLAEAYARKLAGTANPTDLANLKYAESRGWKPGQTGTAPADANALINADQDADMASRSSSDEPATRKTTEEYMNSIREAITPDGEAPDAPEYEEALTDYREKYGLTELEDQINGLRAEEQDILARREARTIAERGKTVEMNVISGRISEVERQENERLSIVQRAISNASNQLNSKYNVVNSLMEAKEMDYNSAVASYDKQMEQNISLFNAAQNMEEQFKNDEQRAIDNARSSAQIMINGFVGTGATYDSLSESQKAMITKLGVESGLGADFYKSVLSSTSTEGKEILTQITSDDKSSVSIIYKDGTSAVVPTGFARGVNTPVGGSGGGGGTVSTEDKEIAKFRNDAAEMIIKLDNDEVDWGAAWDSLKVRYPNASNELLDQTLNGGYDPETQSYYGRAT